MPLLLLTCRNSSRPALHMGQHYDLHVPPVELLFHQHPHIHRLLLLCCVCLGAHWVLVVEGAARPVRLHPLGRSPAGHPQLGPIQVRVQTCCDPATGRAVCCSVGSRDTSGYPAKACPLPDWSVSSQITCAQ